MTAIDEATEETPSGVGERVGGIAGSKGSRRRRALNVGLVIAILGFLFTSMTYVLDRRSQDAADQRAARTELTRLVGEIQALPREYAPLFSSDNPNEEAIASQLDATSSYSYELVALLAQAERVASDHPSIVGAADLLSIGNTHLLLLNYAPALKNLKAAEQASVAGQNLLVATAARRGIAIGYFGLGELGRGRTTFRRAIALAGFKSVPAIVRRSNSALTRYQWVQSELNVGSCEAAKKELEKLKADAAGPVAGASTGTSYATVLQPFVDQCV